MNICDGSRPALPVGANPSPTSLAPAASVLSSGGPKWWRCPVCGFHGCHARAEDAALDLKAHMLNWHNQWIADEITKAALTDQPQTAGSIMELEPTNLPANMEEIAS